MKLKFPDRLKEIRSLVSQMSYTSDNVLDIILLFRETIRIVKKVNPHISKNECLQALKNLKESEFMIMISADINNEAEIRDAFIEFRNDFIRDLRMNCID